MEEAYLLQKHTLKDLNISIPQNSYILDFGCGKGEMVATYIQHGYQNTYGYDIVNYFTGNINRFIDPTNIKNYYNKFDFIFSQQVFEHVQNQQETIMEIYNLLKPGGISLHFFPAKLLFIEPHIKVPFASFIQHPSYLKFWAHLGIRNEFQKDKSAQEAFLANVEYCKNGLNYQSTKNVKRLFSEKFEVQFVEHICLKHTCGRLKHLPSWMRQLPFLPALLRNFSSHAVLAKKPQ